MFSRKVFLGLSAILIAYLYSKYKRNAKKEEIDEDDWERVVFNSWETTISAPKHTFSKVVVGVNCNVDLIVKGTSLLRALKLQPTRGEPHDAVHSMKELEEAFSYYFSKGAAVERHFTNKEQYSSVVDKGSQLPNAQWYTGGNAALMAEKIIRDFPDTQISLVGPVGPRLEGLLDSHITVPDNSKQETDEIHLIMEYKVGEEWGPHEAPIATRFITSYDEANSQMTYLTKFLSTTTQVNPDLVVLSGLHLLEGQVESVWKKKVQELIDGLAKYPVGIPIHLELASMASVLFVKELITKVLPHVTSIGLNEQELLFASKAAGGPNADHVESQPQVSVVKEILAWLLNTYGRTSKKPSSKLTRIHFHSLTYHVIATIRNTWSNCQSSVIAGARAASLQACDTSSFAEERFSIKVSRTIKLSDTIAVRFDPSKPGISWEEGEVEFSYSPVLVCRKPLKTVGLGDAISATGLLYSYYTGSE